jgi:hypothetical protein
MIEDLKRRRKAFELELKNLLRQRERTAAELPPSARPVFPISEATTR